MNDEAIDKIQTALEKALVVIITVCEELNEEEILRVEKGIAFMAEAFDEHIRELREE